MNHIFALVLFFVMAATPAFADRGPAQAQPNSEGSSTRGGIKGCQACQIPWFELSGGTSSFTQTLDNTHTSHPFGYKVSAHQRFGPFHAGVSVLGTSLNDQQQAGTTSQLNINEAMSLETINAGLVIGNLLVLDAGYGLAQMHRSESYPYTAPSSTINTSASGTGFMVGGTVIAIHTKAISLGASYYYFEAKGTSYDQDSVNGSTETKSTAPAKIKSNGSLATATLLFNF